MPDLDDILAGKEIPVPLDIDIQYAVASALVGRAIRSADDAEIGNILDYAAKFPLREMGIMVVSDIHRAIGQRLFAVPQFSQWANAMADVMLYES